MAAIFEHLREAGGFLFVSGQTPLTPTGEVPEGGGEQAALVMEKVAAVLAEAGSSLEDVVKVTYFLTDIGDLAAVRTALDAVLPHPRPAASLVEVSALVDPRFRVEIEATAYRPHP
ncbi:RidA family protein [Nocardioides sp. SR21]|uniref:RidA family protein n=1 Tax=Nocardioides sp. SR21 TaxID=2919501 RepID=UPI001FAADB26|nr:RidA family protein [Nocardioides sp. SR21]